MSRLPIAILAALAVALTIASCGDDESSSRELPLFAPAAHTSAHLIRSVLTRTSRRGNLSANDAANGPMIAISV